MKSLIQIAFLILFSLANSQAAFADSNKIKNNLNVISIYQIEDDTKAGFDFLRQLNHISVVANYRIDFDRIAIMTRWLIGSFS